MWATWDDFPVSSADRQQAAEVVAAVIESQTSRAPVGGRVHEQRTFAPEQLAASASNGMSPTSSMTSRG